MLSQANHEIRRFLDAADGRRQLKRETEAPIRYLDWVLGRLETYRLQGETRVPPAFHALLERTRLTLPAGVEAPRQWGNHIAWAVEQCFRLQGQLFRARRGDFGQDLATQDTEEPIRLRAHAPARARPRAYAPASPSADRLWWAARERGRRQPHVYA